MSKTSEKQLKSGKDIGLKQEYKDKLINAINSADNPWEYIFTQVIGSLDRSLLNEIEIGHANDICKATEKLFEQQLKDDRSVDNGRTNKTNDQQVKGNLIKVISDTDDPIKFVVNSVMMAVSKALGSLIIKIDNNERVNGKVAVARSIKKKLKEQFKDSNMDVALDKEDDIFANTLNKMLVYKAKQASQDRKVYNQLKEYVDKEDK